MWIIREVDKYFYPRPPRGGRHSKAVKEAMETWISIHALREEGDEAFSRYAPIIQDFYPRPPRGGRPVLKLLFTSSDIISIHALREEGDAG